MVHCTVDCRASLLWAIISTRRQSKPPRTYCPVTSLMLRTVTRPGGKDWHAKDKTASKDGAKTRFAQAQDVTCYVCGRKKHVGTFQRQSQRRSGTRGFQGFFTTRTNAKDETERSILKAAVYKQRAAERSDELKDMILLDTGSSIDATFMNPDFLTSQYSSQQEADWYDDQCGYQADELGGQCEWVRHSLATTIPIKWRIFSDSPM